MNNVFIKLKNIYKFIFRKTRKFIFHNKFIYKITSLVFSLLVYLYIFLLKISCRIHIEFPKKYQNVPVIFCFWHGRMIMTIFARKKVDKVSILLSKGKDAELISCLMKMFKISTVRGSASRNRKNKGGASSLKCMINLLTKQKEPIAIASDGPIGPLMRLMPGIAMLSLTTNIPVIPLALSAKPNITLGTWDKFILPLPFSKIVVKMGEAIFPYDENNNKKNLENYREEIEKSMLTLTQELDKKLNLPIMYPSNLDKKKRPFKYKK